MCSKCDSPGGCDCLADECGCWSGGFCATCNHYPRATFDDPSSDADTEIARAPAPEVEDD
jgi:hypothetical protein